MYLKMSRPILNKMIPLVRVDIGKEEIRAVSKVLKSGWLTMGPETQLFEEEFARYVGAKYAIAVNSATSALFLALKALKVGSGDEVIVPSFTFASSANVIVHCGATPVFVDIKFDDFTMDQKSLDAAITSKTKAVIPVHYGANRAIIKTNLPVIEDSAHLIKRNGDNKKAFASCYSFNACSYPTHVCFHTCCCITKTIIAMDSCCSRYKACSREHRLRLINGTVRRQSLRFDKSHGQLQGRLCSRLYLG